MSHLRSVPKVALAAALTLAAAACASAAADGSSGGTTATTATGGAHAKNGKQVDLPSRFGKASRFVDDGTGLGDRSVQVTITNDAWGSLIVEGPAIDPGAAWVSGETPSPGQSLPRHNAARLGVMTNDVDGSAGGQLMLTGLGSYPVTVAFANTSNGVSNALVNGNDAVQAIVTQVDTGEQHHTRYQVQLLPV